MGPTFCVGFVGVKDAFYIVPTLGGSARRVGNIGGNCGGWSADGREVFINRGDTIYAIKRDGSSSRKLVTLWGAWVGLSARKPSAFQCRHPYGIPHRWE